MRLQKPYLLLMTLLLWSSVMAHAKVVYVSASGSDGNSGLSPTLPKRNIQSGLNAAVSGDAVWVAAGTYFEHLSVAAGIQLLGGYNSNFSQRNRALYVTIVDGGGGGRVVYTQPGTGHQVDGFTLRNGITGILVDGSPTISNNLVTQNTPWSGIEVDSGAPSITDNVVSNNYSMGDGGGMILYFCTPYLANNEVRDNLSDRNVGGISLYQCPRAVVTGNQVIHNITTKNFAGGIGIFNLNPASATVTDNVVTDNSALGADGSGGIAVTGTTLTLSNNEIRNNFANSRGGGIFLDTCTGTVADNLVDSNRSNDSGGGIAIVNSKADIVHNTITNNHANGFGGGVRPVSSTVRILNNVITDNR